MSALVEEKPRTPLDLIQFSVCSAGIILAISGVVISSAATVIWGGLLMLMGFAYFWVLMDADE